MLLPRAAPGAAGLYLADYGQRALSSQPAGATGSMVVQFPTVPDGEVWLVDRFVVSSTSTSATRARLYVDTADPSRLLDGSDAGNLDVADNSSPIQLLAGTALVIVWSGASLGAVGTARAQWSVMRRQAT